MKNHRVFVAGLLACFGSPALAQTTRIDHQGVACAVAERFPRLEASLHPVESVAIARIVFQGAGPEWYSVPMKAQGGSFVGVLPKPKKSLKAFRYYIEVTDKALGTNRTPEFNTTVIESTGACKGGLLAGALGSASVVLQGPAGIATLPAGFASTGVVAGTAAGSGGAAGAAGGAGGGGLSGTTIGLVGGVVAGGALVATQVGGAGSTYQGPFQMSTVQTRRSGPGGPVICTYTLAIAGTLRIEDFDERGGSVTGHFAGDWSETATAGNCGFGGENDRVEGDFSGTAGSIQFSRTFTDGQVTRTRSFSGSLSSGAIVGTWTMSFDFLASTPNTAGVRISEAYPATSVTVTLPKQ